MHKSTVSFPFSGTSSGVNKFSDCCCLFTIIPTKKYFTLYSSSAWIWKERKKEKNVSVWVCAGTAGVFALPFSALGSACPFKSVSGSLVQEMNYYLSEGEEKKRKGGVRDWQRKSILSRVHCWSEKWAPAGGKDFKIATDIYTSSPRLLF